MPTNGLAEPTRDLTHLLGPEDFAAVNILLVAGTTVWGFFLSLAVVDVFPLLKAHPGAASSRKWRFAVRAIAQLWR